MERLLKGKDVLTLIGVSRASLWRMEKAGLFPKRIQLSERRVAWRECDITAWMKKLPQVDRKNEQGGQQ